MPDKCLRADLVKNNYISKIYYSLQDALTYKPQVYPDPFVLKGWENENKPKKEKTAEAVKMSLKNSLKTLEDNLHYAREIADFFEESLLSFKGKHSHQTGKLKIAGKISKLSQRKMEITQPRRAFENALAPAARTVSGSLGENEEILRRLYHSPPNKDIIFHHFEICAPASPQAMLVFIDGMVDKEIIDLAVLEPLMLSFCETCEKEEGNRSGPISPTAVKERLPSHIVKLENNYKKIAGAINTGDTALFIDGADEAILMDTKGYAHRGVQKAEIEQSIQGTQSAFTEIIQINTSLIRSLMPTADLVNESLPVGDRIQTACSVIYLKSLANERLVNEVKRRLRGIRTDYINDVGTLNQFIEDQPNLFFPKCLQTERPDRTALHLAEGRVAILMHGSPFAIIVPVTFSTFFQFVEDYNIQLLSANIKRFVRIGGAFFSMLLSGLYIALSYFHQEAIPTDLALAIDVYREKVPFPAIAEILIMEIVFELTREAGLRVPGVLGPTIGIVGAIVLGQAAVAANLVSPIIVVLISVTGLASFVIPDYHMASVFRNVRFAFLALAYFGGLAGIGIGLFLFTLLLCCTKSFGVPYMSPWQAKTTAGFDVLFKEPAFYLEERPGFLQVKDKIRQRRISREWALEEPGEGEKQK